jgi:hypothetical protein
MLFSSRWESSRTFWRGAIDEELFSLISMNTWQSALLPSGRTAILCKWVLKRNLNADGSVEGHKARLVLKGFRQRPGVDFDAVFAPVVRMSTVRLFFTVVASQDLEYHQIDFKNVFVQGCGCFLVLALSM